MAQADRVVFVALVLLATAYVVKCQFSGTNITQIQVLGRGLTCSNPSPFPFSFLFPRPVLSGANVSLSCNGSSVLNTTSTTDSGNFTLVVNNPVATGSFFPLFNCRLLVTLPANCTVTTFFRRITTLRSLALSPIRVETNTTGGGQTLTATSGIFIGFS